MKLFPTFYETPDVTTVAGAVTPPEPVVETPPAVQPGPWAADLTEYFGDNPEAIAAADRYMREKVQPRITHLETESAPARELYKDLLANPEETLTAVFEEIYGEDKAAEFAALLTPAEAAAVVEAAAAGAAEAGEDEVPAWAKPLLEKHEQQTDAELRETQAAEYQEVLAEMRAAHTDLTDDDMNLIHPFMSAAGGDIERAYAGYQAYTEAFKPRHGVTPAEAAETPPPPAVLTSEGSTAAAPPIQKEYTSFEEAWDDWKAEQATVAPPPVI